MTPLDLLHLLIYDSTSRHYNLCLHCVMTLWRRVSERLSARWSLFSVFISVSLLSLSSLSWYLFFVCCVLSSIFLLSLSRCLIYVCLFSFYLLCLLFSFCLLSVCFWMLTANCSWLSKSTLLSRSSGQVREHLVQGFSLSSTQRWLSYSVAAGTQQFCLCCPRSFMVTVCLCICCHWSMRSDCSRCVAAITSEAPCIRKSRFVGDAKSVPDRWVVTFISEVPPDQSQYCQIWFHLTENMSHLHH
jgi:hypothetical protein